MREIKFRVWDGVGYMSASFTLFDVQSKYVQFTSDCVLMQYTGVKDKYGKEICEGDILFEQYEDIMEETGFGQIKVAVGFANGSFGWIGENTKELHSFLEFPTNEAEIIGNIYENPELLKQ